MTHGCAGLWNDEQEAAWKRLVDFTHAHTAAKIALQIGHAGAKGAVRCPWENDSPMDHVPLPANEAWPLVSASAIPYSAESQVPAALTSDDMATIKAQFVESAQRAARAGFDAIELHAAHGHLLSAFITPLLNHRNDEYSGPLQNRLRYPLEVFTAIRDVWPSDKPISVRISAHDWMGDSGITEPDALVIANAFKQAGADIIHVSSGEVSPDQKPRPGRMFQTPLSDMIRNELNVPTIAVGNIYEVDHVNSIIAAGRADLVALGRPHLADPNWTLRAAASEGYHGVGVSQPKQYSTGLTQLETLAHRISESPLDH
jgi:anthraniloyl-CoA monooxygenase